MRGVSRSRSNVVALLMTGTIALGTGCGGTNMDTIGDRGEKARKIPREQLELLAEKTIYFGHQSVGNNIIAGLEDVISSMEGFSLPIIESRDGARFTEPAFYHSPIGENRQPFSKIEDFRSLIGTGIGARADIAFFKFCYIDFEESTDPSTVLESYRAALAELKSSYPETTFVHVTVPLTIVQKGPRVWVKNIIGRPIGGYAENRVRNEYNDLLRNEYSGREPLFDLARVESTWPDGRQETFVSGGKTYRALVPVYGRDGRHLNESGRAVAAEELLVFLAGLF